MDTPFKTDENIVANFESAPYTTTFEFFDGRTSEAQKREHQRLSIVGANVTTVYGESGVDQFTPHLVFND